MIGSGRGTKAAGADRGALRVAELAGRLTDRDRQLCRLLFEHRVLTSHQLTHLAFNHLDTAEDRLRTLTRLGVLDRFRPRRDTGSAPYHYVLGPLDAATLAAEQNITVAELGYRRATTLAIAHSRQLPEIVAVNSFFCALAGHARQHPDTELTRWLSQRRCHTIWGTLVQPHGFGRWRDHHSALEFVLHYADQEPMGQLIAALAGYDTLAQATPQLATNLLVWLTSPSEKPNSTAPFPHAPTSSPPPSHSPTATPPRRSGFPSAAPSHGNA